MEEWPLVGFISERFRTPEGTFRWPSYKNSVTRVGNTTGCRTTRSIQNWISEQTVSTLIKKLNTHTLHFAILMLQNRKLLLQFCLLNFHNKCFIERDWSRTLDALFDGILVPWLICFHTCHLYCFMSLNWIGLKLVWLKYNTWINLVPIVQALLWDYMTLCGININIYFLILCRYLLHYYLNIINLLTYC